MKVFLGYVLAGMIFLSGHLQASDSLVVTTSIKPVSMIVKAIAGDKVKIEQVVSNSASPHDFALRPSDIKKLYKADLVVWVGESLEPFLEKPIANSKAANSAIEWMLLVEGHDSEQGLNNHVEVKHHDHGDGHHHAGMDPHLWLDVEYAQILAASIAAKLAHLRPSLAAYFANNLTQFEQALTRIDAQNKDTLTSLSQANYVVFHDAYGYFERHYNLQHVANISLSPERKPGAKKVVALRKLMESKGVDCIFSEVQFNPAIVDVLIEGTQVKAIELDPLGAGIPLTKNAYPEFLEKMSQQFSQCG